MIVFVACAVMAEEKARRTIVMGTTNATRFIFYFDEEKSFLSAVRSLK
jgi:hypothetical protein